MSNLILIIAALCNNLEHLRLTRYCGDMNYVRWKMSSSRITVASLPPFCQKLSKLVEILRSSDKNKFAQFSRHGVVRAVVVYRPNFIYRHSLAFRQMREMSIVVHRSIVNQRLCWWSTDSALDPFRSSLAALHPHDDSRGLPKDRHFPCRSTSDNPS